ncbi:MAG: MaoC family dehydratase [Planctomycetota bacterium]
MHHEIDYDGYVIGHERTTTGRTMTEADIILHAGQTGDFFPHHMDAEWCKTQEFKQRLVHGTLTFSVGVGLTATVINPLAISYGYDRLRFVAPVFIGDTLTTRVTITEKKDHARKPDVGIVTEHLDVRNQHDATVLVCDHLLLVQKQG